MIFKNYRSASFPRRRWEASHSVKYWSWTCANSLRRIRLTFNNDAVGIAPAFWKDNKIFVRVVFLAIKLSSLWPIDFSRKLVHEGALTKNLSHRFRGTNFTSSFLYPIDSAVALVTLEHVIVLLRFSLNSFSISSYIIIRGK